MPQILKERPTCRKIIIREKWRPDFGPNGKWDGIMGIDASGKRFSPSEGLRMQMKKMIKEGYWEKTDAASS